MRETKEAKMNLKQVHDKFDLMKETLFLTVNLIDRFLSKKAVMRKKLQLVGLVALLLACKYEEVSVPLVEDLVLISDRAYTRTDVLHMVKLLLNLVSFKTFSLIKIGSAGENNVEHFAIQCLVAYTIPFLEKIP